MPYDRKLVLAHLAEYKRDHMGIEENGSWRGREYPHILPRDLFARNLIDQGSLPCLKRAVSESAASLHAGFHHLNSSQVLPAKKRVVHPKKVKVLPTDEIAAMHCFRNHQRLRTHYGQFQRKYLRIDGMRRQSP